jgi:[ribosomal protein S5]-alanine N-acetyltransferase
MKVPTLETERLILRTFKPEDLADFADVMSDKEAMWDLYAIEGVPDDASGFANWFINDTIESWDTSGLGHWAICTKEPEFERTGRVIGFAGFIGGEHLSYDPNVAIEVAWTIHPDFGGRGLASEASHAAVKYGFDVLKAPKLVAITDHMNTSSRRLMERLGMSYSETISSYGVENQVVYTMTPEQWSQQNSDSG